MLYIWQPYLEDEEITEIDISMIFDVVKMSRVWSRFQIINTFWESSENNLNESF